MHPFEAEVLEGLELIARDEIKTLIGERGKVEYAKNGAVRFQFAGSPRELIDLQTVTTVYTVASYPVPRPKALLGHQHFQILLSQIQRVLSMRFEFRTFFLSAAGSESSVMQRLKEEIGEATGLLHGEENGDLLIRLRRAKDGWETLIRITPRPLATRAWRVCNFEGALNAAVAHTMALLAQPTPDDVYLNLACGSGSLLIERLRAVQPRIALGCDISDEVLRCARENLDAAGKSAHLFRADVGRLPLPDNSVDSLAADLPFGQLVGTHTQNKVLYPALLREAARVARPNATLILITHELRLLETLLSESQVWSTQNVLRVTFGGLHPRIYVLRKIEA
jgi:tRNA (guanine6-N2)-methyltransferase